MWPLTVQYVIFDNCNVVTFNKLSLSLSSSHVQVFSYLRGPCWKFSFSVKCICSKYLHPLPQMDHSNIFQTTDKKTGLKWFATVCIYLCNLKLAEVVFTFCPESLQLSWLYANLLTDCQCLNRHWFVLYQPLFTQFLLTFEINCTTFTGYFTNIQ